MCEWQRTQGETFASFAALRNGSKSKFAEAIPLNAQATWRVHHLARRNSRAGSRSYRNR